MLEQATSTAPQKRPRNMTKKKSEATLRAHMPALFDFSAGLQALADAAPDRLTMAQGLTFMHIALADLTGKATTFTDLRESVGDVIGKSVHTTYRVLLDEGRNRDGKREPGMGWVSREDDPKDNRRKYLHLTPKGREAIARVAEHLAIRKQSEI